MGLLEGNISLLSDDELDRIHSAALAILAETGVKVEHERMLELLAATGAQVDHAAMVVRFPAKLMEENIRKAARTQQDKAANKDGADSSEFSLFTAGTCPYVFDMEGDSIRLATKADYEQATIVGDYLDSVKGVGGMFYPRDVPPETDDVHAWEVTLTRTSKPSGTLVMNRSSVKPIHEMCQVAGFDDFSYGCFPSSPLMFPRYALDITFETHDLGLPVGFGGSMVIAGSTAPVTLAGSIVQGSAEALACIMLAHALGLEGGFGAVPAVMDQHTMVACYASPEKILMTLATRIFLLRYYGFPLGELVHVMKSDSNYPGQQSGVERTASAVLAALAGARAGYGGELSQECASLPQLVMDDEICNYITRLLKGITVTEETIALDLIKKVGIGGTYITNDDALDHTVKHVRSEMWQPRLFDRRRAENFCKGEHETYERAKERVRHILKEHNPHPLGREQEQEIRAIRERADKSFAK